MPAKKAAKSSGKKPDVRRMWFSVETAANNAGVQQTIFTAEQNVTLVGVDLHVVVSGDDTAVTGIAEWCLKAADSSVLAIALTASDIEESRSIFVHKLESHSPSSAYAYDIQKKYKRKLVKGESIYFASDFSATDAASVYIVSGYLYIME